jgi:hypothetical protein
MAEDSELDRLVRASLERRAGEMDTAAPVAEHARGAVRRRRQGRIAVGAAAALVLVAAVTGFVVRGDNDRPPPVTDRGEDVLPTEWRTEYWHDMKVDVPADWGYGGAPVESGGLMSCFPGAMIGPDGAPMEGQPTRGYVGRPIVLTDVCVPYPDNRPDAPQAPYVWLGADIETGTVMLGNGYVQETVKAQGSTLTVASDNPGLRQRILDSAAEEGETCLSEFERLPRLKDLGFDPSTRTACAYRWNGTMWRLAYATDLSADQAGKFTRAFASAPERGHSGFDCDVGMVEEFVLLEIEGTAYVAYFEKFGCPAFISLDKSVHLTPELMDPWSGNGFRAVLSYLIGPQG